MPKAISPYDIAAVLEQHENWPPSRLAEHFNLSEETIRRKLRIFLSELQCEISDMESQAEEIERYLNKKWMRCTGTCLRNNRFKRSKK